MNNLPAVPVTDITEIRQHLSVLNSRYRRLRILVSCLASFCILITGIFLMSMTGKSPVNTTFENSVLKVRGLVVVDSNGVERVWVGAPLPDPLIFGKRIYRDDAANGILLFDKTGTERSGYCTFDGSNSVVFTLDQAGRMVANFAAGPTGGVKLMMTDEFENQISLGSYNKGPYLRFLQRDSVKNKVMLINADSATGLNIVPKK